MEPECIIKCGDCMAEMIDVPAGSVDLILCDLPYGQTKNVWDKKLDLDAVWKEYRRVIKPNGVILLFGSGMFTAELMTGAGRKLWRYNLIWEKSQPTGFLNAKRMPMRAHEDICVFYEKLPCYNPQMGSGPRKVSTAKHKRNTKHGDTYGSYRAVGYDSTQRYPRSVIHCPTDKQISAVHSAQKPVALLEYLIRTYSNEGDLVLDCCMGSGSTGVACVNTNRRFIGIEKDATICKQAESRIREAQIRRDQDEQEEHKSCP